MYAAQSSKMRDLKTKLLTAMNTAMILAVMGPVRTFAAEDASWLNNSSGNGQLDNLNETVKGYAQGIYGICMTIGIAVAVICGITAAIKLMSPDARKRTEGKDTILYVLIGAALLGGMIAVISWAMSIGAEFKI